MGAHSAGCCTFRRQRQPGSRRSTESETPAIEPVTGFLHNEVDNHGRFVRIESVHPLLCGVGGPITVLPDHPHEGEVVSHFNINALSEAEYPRNNTTGPVPQVVAFAHSGRPSYSAAILQYEGGPVDPGDFATIGAYDGQQVDIGRVVVDSSLQFRWWPSSEV